MNSPIQTAAAVVGILLAFVVIAGFINTIYIPRAEAYTRVEAKRHEDVSLQIHTQLNMMLLEERLRRYREESGPVSTEAELKQIQTRLEAIDGLFRRQILGQDPISALQLGVQ